MAALTDAVMDRWVDAIRAARTVDAVEAVQGRLRSIRDTDPADVDWLLMVANHQLREAAFREIYHRIVEVRGIIRNADPDRFEDALVEVERVVDGLVDRFKRLVR